MTDKFQYAYVHGFASSEKSRKAAYLAKVFGAHQRQLLRPNLNRPTFRQLTYSGALEVLDELDQKGGEGKWRFIGSSMGGYLAARWAQLHPERVDRLVLLCPGFNLVERWPKLVGDHRMKRWEKEGELRLPGPKGKMEPVHWGFIEDARTHPPVPEVPCETIIVHGTRDPTVPVGSSRKYAAARDHVKLYEVDDLHGLIKSVDFIAEKALEFFGITADAVYE